MSTLNLTSLQKKEKNPYKTSKLILSNAQNWIKDRMQILICIKVVLAKSSQQALIRLHSCVNMAWGKTLENQRCPLFCCIADDKEQLRDLEVVPVCAGLNTASFRGRNTIKTRTSLPAGAKSVFGQGMNIIEEHHWGRIMSWSDKDDR